MDRRNPQNNRGNPRPFDHVALTDRTYREILCRNGRINGLREFRSAFEQERVSFIHSIHKEKDKVKRLEELLSHIDSGNDQQLKRQFDTIKNCEAEISRLKKNMEAAECQHNQQVDIILARHEVEKGLLSDQSNQGTSDSHASDGPLQLDGETTKLLMRKGDELLECVTVWEQRYSALEETMEAAERQHKQQLDKKVAWYEAQTGKLSDQKHQGRETINLLMSKEEELIQFVKVLLGKNSALKEKMEAGEHQHKQQMDTMVAHQQELSDQSNQANLETLNLLHRREKELLQCEEKFTKNLAEKHQTWESEKQQMETKFKEVSQEKNDLAKENLSWETEFKQVETNLKKVEKQKNHLAKKNKSWERDFKQLKEQKDMFSKDLAQNSETWETKVTLVDTKLKEVTQEKDDLAQQHQSSEKELKEVQAELQMVEDEKKESDKKNLSLEKEVKLKDRKVKQLENDLEEQKEKLTRDLAEKHQSWELFVKRNERHVKQLKIQLEEQKEMFSKDLAQNQDSWETKVNLVETKLKEVTQEKDDLAQQHQNRETELKEVQAEFKTVEDKKNQSWEREVKLMETKVKQFEEQMKEQKGKFSKDMAQKQQSWETKEKKMEEEKKLLEDLSLHMKNKRRGLFSRRRDMEDRDVTLQKMLSKMQEKEMKKESSWGGAEASNTSEETVKTEDASGDSAPAGQQ
ncbi:golgin subfamily A member 6-like protein 25 [Eleginops maclovinus]|uniref:golgin subfamily A member 6-like protein 25 n=1 Tax=Eleginops maclovinus TaxID=56733 RepID=UPI0030800441